MGAPTAWPDREVHLVHAVVQVGERVTEYVRAGRGRTVLLLADGGRRHLPPDPLLEELAGSHRVIAATVPAEGDPSTWLAGLVEGLGVDRPDVVVRGPGPWVAGLRARMGEVVGMVIGVDGGGAGAGPGRVAEALRRED